MFCNKCGADNPADGVFCQKCGASLSGASSSAPANTNSNPAPGPGVLDGLKALPIPTILMGAAAVILFLGFLTGILYAASDNNRSDAGEFFKYFMEGIFYAGVVLALSVIAAARR